MIEQPLAVTQIMENTMYSSGHSPMIAPFLQPRKGPDSPAVVLTSFARMASEPGADIEIRAAGRRVIDASDQVGPVSADIPCHLPPETVSGDLTMVFGSDESLARWLEELTVWVPPEGAGAARFNTSGIHARQAESPLQVAFPNGIPSRRHMPRGSAVARPSVKPLADRSSISAEVLGALNQKGEAVVFLIRLLRRPEEATFPATIRSNAGLPKWRLKRACAFIEDNLEEPITLKALAGAAGLSPTYFAAQFKNSTGVRPHDYVMRRRIETAQQQLLDSRLSIIEIAIGVGFQTQAHFTTSFKKIVGQTPCQWRRENYDDQ